MLFISLLVLAVLQVAISQDPGGGGGDGGGSGSNGPVIERWFGNKVAISNWYMVAGTAKGMYFIALYCKPLKVWLCYPMFLLSFDERYLQMY